MRSLEEIIRLKKNIRVIGFDDAPFGAGQNEPVHLAGVVCSGTRFEGMLWGEVTRDGLDATNVITNMLLQSKFYQQVNVVLIDGIAVGGFNIIDLPVLTESLQRPCIVVMRQYPDNSAIDRALKNLSEYQLRKQYLSRAGKIYRHQSIYYQVCGCAPDTAAQVLERLTDTGHIPEALRLAHLIAAAIITGESSNRA